MKNRRFQLFCLIVLALVPIVFLPGCRHTKAATISETGVIPPAEWKTLAEEGKPEITDDSPSEGLWIPNNPDTLAKVVARLRQAEPYAGEVPQWNASQIRSLEIYEPSRLRITTPDGNELSLQPAFYYSVSSKDYTFHAVADVLFLVNNGRKSMIRSKPLYRWLKENQWRAECKAA